MDGLRDLLDARPARLLTLGGLGEARVAAIKAARALAERYQLSVLRATAPLTDVRAALNYLQLRLGGRRREIFGCVFLDCRHRVLAFEELFLGSVDRAAVYPRELLQRSLELNAAAVILAHNHPSGVAEPSQSDIELTQRLRTLFAEVDIRLLDHLIIGAGPSVSLAQRCLI